MLAQIEPSAFSGASTSSPGSRGEANYLRLARAALTPSPRNDAPENHRRMHSGRCGSETRLGWERAPSSKVCQTINEAALAPRRRL